MMIKFYDFMPIFKKIKEALEKYSLIVIIGESGTGKTSYINEYFKEKPEYHIIRVDSFTNEKQILKTIRMQSNILFKKIVIIYDDIKIKNSILYEAKKYIHLADRKKQLIVIINKFSGFMPVGLVEFKTTYPTREEVLYYLKDKKISLELKNEILKLSPYNMRHIKFALEDGYITTLKESEDDFHITRTNNIIISMGIAENYQRLRKLKKTIIEADKLKLVNKHFYLDYLKCLYPNIEKMRLRYPTELMEIKKGEKNGT